MAPGADRAARGDLREASVIVVYVAGPFRAPTAWEIEQNIRRAENVGFLVAKIGAVPVIPHTQYRFFQGSLPDEFWLEATLEQLRRCDAVALVDGWQNSEGTGREIDAAKMLGIPVFEDLSKLGAWLERVERRGL